MNNEELYDKAVEAVQNLFSDNSVSIEECRINMNTLISEIQMLLDSLPEDDD